MTRVQPTLALLDPPEVVLGEARCVHQSRDGHRPDPRQHLRLVSLDVEDPPVLPLPSPVREHHAPDAADVAEIGESETEPGAVADWSEHGIGLYLDPTDPDRPRRDGSDRRIWTRQVWEWVLASIDGPAPAPPWADTYALTRFTVSGPRLQSWFAGHDAAVAGELRIRPGCFGLIAHPYGYSDDDTPSPAAPYERDPSRWPELVWYDRNDGQPIRVHTTDPARDPERFAFEMQRGAVRIHTLREVMESYVKQAEHKSLAPDGRAVDGWTTGLLGRRPVSSAPLLTDP